MDVFPSKSIPANLPFAGRDHVIFLKDWVVGISMIYSPVLKLVTTVLISLEDETTKDESATLQLAERMP